MPRKAMRLIAAAGALLAIGSIGASAELTILGQNPVWLPVSQSACVERAAARVAELPDLFDTGAMSVTSFDWYVIATSDTAVVEVMCVGDDESGDVINPAAQRVLAVVEVFSENFGNPSARDAGMVDYVVTCLTFDELCGGAHQLQADAIPAPDIREIAWDDSSEGLGFYNRVGQQFTLHCPRAAISDFSSRVWGTDIYTGDFVVCVAAVHAGAISTAGGVITIDILPGQSSYQGSERNGVVTSSWSSFGTSFSFAGSAVEAAPAVETLPVKPSRAAEAAVLGPAAEATPIDWRDSINSLGQRDATGQRFTYFCPAWTNGSIPSSVYGSDIYTSDSYICPAAVHAGMVTTAGGAITVEILRGQASYSGSERNGVRSSNWGSFDGSFRFVGN